VLFNVLNQITYLNNVLTDITWKYMFSLFIEDKSITLDDSAFQQRSHIIYIVMY